MKEISKAFDRGAKEAFQKEMEMQKKLLRHGLNKLKKVEKEILAWEQKFRSLRWFNTQMQNLRELTHIYFEVGGQFATPFREFIPSLVEKLVIHLFRARIIWKTQEAKIKTLSHEALLEWIFLNFWSYWRYILALSEGLLTMFNLLHEKAYLPYSRFPLLRGKEKTTWAMLDAFYTEGKKFSVSTATGGTTHYTVMEPASEPGSMQIENTYQTLLTIAFGYYERDPDIPDRFIGKGDCISRERGYFDAIEELRNFLESYGLESEWVEGLDEKLEREIAPILAKRSGQFDQFMQAVEKVANQSQSQMERRIDQEIGSFDIDAKQFKQLMIYTGLDREELEDWIKRYDEKLRAGGIKLGKLTFEQVLEKMKLNPDVLKQSELEEKSEAIFKDISAASNSAFDTIPNPTQGEIQEFWRENPELKTLPSSLKPQSALQTSFVQGDEKQIRVKVRGKWVKIARDAQSRQRLRDGDNICMFKAIYWFKLPKEYLDKFDEYMHEDFLAIIANISEKYGITPEIRRAIHVTWESLKYEGKDYINLNLCIETTRPLPELSNQTEQLGDEIKKALKEGFLQNLRVNVASPDFWNPHPSFYLDAGDLQYPHVNLIFKASQFSNSFKKFLVEMIRTLPEEMIKYKIEQEKGEYLVTELLPIHALILAQKFGELNPRIIGCQNNAEITLKQLDTLANKRMGPIQAEGRLWESETRFTKKDGKDVFTIDESEEY